MRFVYLLILYNNQLINSIKWDGYNEIHTRDSNIFNVFPCNKNVIL